MCASNSSTRFSLNSVNQSGIFANGSCEFSMSSSFSFGFGFLGLHQFPAACPSLLSNTGLDDELDESCGRCRRRTASRIGG